jgi:hypothetical protein
VDAERREIMHRTGLSRYGEEGQGVRPVAVHQGENHIHIAATLARQHGRRARLDNDRYRIGEALRDIEKEYGLQHFRERLAEEPTTGYRSWDEAVAGTRARREAGQ